MPKPNSKLPENVRLRVKWLLDVDLLMKDLSELAAMNEDAYCEVYNDSTIKMIKSYFPIKIHTQMSGSTNSTRIAGACSLISMARCSCLSRALEITFRHRELVEAAVAA